MQPDNERGRPAKDAPGKLAAKLATDPQDTADLLTVDSTEILVLDAELAQVIADRREVGSR